MIYICVRKKLWLPKGIRPVVTVTGSHQRTCVFGTLTRESKQLFRQYDMFNQDTFLDYLKQGKKRLGKKVVMFTDRARQHQSNKVQKYLKENKDSLMIVYFPKGSPEFNAVEEC
ncbi:MAG: transposase [Candidatus Nitrosocosmicus sp.]